ncbi:loricrin-like isoform X2 [Neocloeon triangulifer]|uniref:loricrin-like isoform X2 n=1 Tax=Neocloeon triangulifer TaxID=2078957 RepID=UPI00286F6829|nr:loricrin-like isoform X2 [Neocloeon triangulifer]
MKVYLAIALCCAFVAAAAGAAAPARSNKMGYQLTRDQLGGPGGGGGGGAGNENGPGQNGGNGGGVGGGEGGQGGWGGPVSEGTDAECVEIARLGCPAVDGPVPVLLINPSDCGSFCMCANSVGKFMPCADGLHFSQAQQVCTWPWEAQCRVTMIPHPEA